MKLVKTKIKGKQYARPFYQYNYFWPIFNMQTDSHKDILSCDFGELDKTFYAECHYNLKGTEPKLLYVNEHNSYEGMKASIQSIHEKFKAPVLHENELFQTIQKNRGEFIKEKGYAPDVMFLNSECKDYEGRELLGMRLITSDYVNKSSYIMYKTV